MKMKYEDGIGWCLIPPTIVSRRDLTSNEKLIVGRVIGLSTKSGYCYASNKWLGKQFGLSGGSTSNIISSLVKKQLLKREVIRNDKKQIIQRKLYPVAIERWIPINSRIEDSGRDISNRVNNDNGFSLQKNETKDTDTIQNHLKKNPSIYEEINLAIQYYAESYEKCFDKPHPRITPIQFERAVDGFLSLDEMPFVEGDLVLDEYKKIIDDWFEDEYVKSDYNILHFSNERVISYHYLKVYK
ncbi:hypothetical protein A2858_02510 [Candidatus Daviesbacteria bacterium RIFCSPHIGHO2_01_FULL_36_37]|uniref:Uncharacterized protein n=3 Tax=Candidatus Daviesiibacteriota TaxID=1752718 RepID=A0A1F5K1K6_9BACT|nr:MAG: hypothetical protein US28_C0017G0004 [Candidatus Daviesbacteria bacterium GW2011_GWA1_36_8]OGE16686.1 MAG: hypothetical protein A2858_02510 [Candidatus Daviesbacteria bacterium RIFCSPHIGHO2_01_FULL_36_37]OGE34763.1 MAG: hypothetical protein A3E66_04030 [Candidatus Daviesbacteria bacterium RIFCSPHIGHO2_12_FULL_37_16]